MNAQNNQPVDFLPEAIQEYWNISLPENLPENETIRTVIQFKDPQNPDAKEAHTPKVPVRNPQDLINLVQGYKTSFPNKEVGVSVSTGVFEYTGEAPNKNHLKYMRTVAVDIDAHIKKGQKERYHMHTLNEDQLNLAVVRTWVEMMNKFPGVGLNIVRPAYSLITGGGLQIVLAFERQINKDEAERMLAFMKSVMGNLTWEQLALNEWGNIDKPWLEIDSTFSDTSHVQRIAGIKNQKYGNMVRKLEVFNYTKDEMILFRERAKGAIDDTGYTDAQKQGYKESVDALLDKYQLLMDQAQDTIEVESNLITAKMQTKRSFIKPSELKNIEYELLQKLKTSNISTEMLIGDVVRLGPHTGNLTRIYCPFHEESNPSMALYTNELFDVFKDFHDDKSYSLITFWEKLFQVSKSTAISQIAEKAGITLGKTERKEFQNLEIAEIIDELIRRIDTENFVYYRLASKNRTCIVRHIDSGEAFVFDGPKMLASHILQNQLGIEDAELALQEEFNKAFQEKVLIDAFEEFYPGKPTVFSKQFIKFVNLWVPSEKYKRCHTRADEIRENLENPFSIDETIALLKRKTPWTYKYILQVVQNGDLNWFINWLSGTSKFKTMPTVPVIFGVQGAGKNLFVNTVMDFYLNNEYVKVVSGDRIMQQFNSMLESTSLLVLDEGDFSTGKEVDQLKLLTGNDKILIEKKGVDASNKLRHFNILFFSNGEVPLRHPAMDRRITYFNNEIPLLASCEVWGLSIDDLVERVQSEMVEFWAIILNTALDHKMAMANSKNGQFWKQILMQHPFGALVVKLMNNEWEDIALQLNENVSDPAEMQANLQLLETIKEQFNRNGSVSLTLINRYLQSLNFRMKQSIQKFIQTNHLHEFGISVVVESDDVKIQVNKNKVRDSLKVENVLRKAYPKTGREEVSGLEAELAMEEADAGVEAEKEFEDELLPPPPPDL